MTQVVCANCGQPLRPTDKFCYNCGAKIVPIKMAPEVEKAEPKPPVARDVPKPAAPVQEKPQEEKPKFHMDESLSWNTDGYPDPQRHAAATEETSGFSWNDTSAQDRIRQRQEEGRKALYEEQLEREAAKKAREAEAAKAAAFEKSNVVEINLDEAPGFGEPSKPAATYEAPAASAPETAYAPAASGPETSYAPAASGSETSYAPAPAQTPSASAEDISAYAPESYAAETPAEPEAPAEPKAADDLSAYAPANQAPEAPAEPEAPAASPFAPGYARSYEEEDDGEVPTIESIEAAAKAQAEAKAEAEAKAQAEAAAKAQAEAEARAQAEAEAKAKAEAEAAKAQTEAEKAMAAEKARETEKEIFGYTLDDVDAREESGKGPEVIDKFYTYSKKNEEFQELLNQENDRLKNNRPDEKISETEAYAAPEEVQPEKPAAPLTEEEAGGFVGVQLPETPMEADAGTDEYSYAYKPVSAGVSEAPKAEAPAAEPKAEPEFLDGNFGKADEAAKEIQEISDVKPEAENSEADKSVAAAAGTVAASAAAIAAIADKIKANKEKAGQKAEEFKEAAAYKADEVKEAVTEKAEEVKAEVAEKKEAAAEKIEADQAEAEKAAYEFKEAAAEKAEEVQDSFNVAKEETVQEVKEETEEIKEEIEKEVDEEEHKLTYQEVFNQEAEKTSKHTFLKIICILILLLIILEVVAILIRRFAPDSAAGQQIQQIYEMLFSRFTGR